MKFFISYTRADFSWAEWIAWQLEESGLEAILQAWDFRAGCNFVLEMDSAVKKAQRTIAVLSANYLSAAYTHPEWASALARDPTGEKGVLLPVRVEDCTLTGLLAQVVYIDLVGLTETDAKGRLFSHLLGERGKPSAAPHFPGASRGQAEAPPYPASGNSIDAAEHQAPSSHSYPVLGSDACRKAEQDLLPHVGPVATLLVQRAVAKARTPADLYADLAAAIPSGNEREKFLRIATDRCDAATSRSVALNDDSQRPSTFSAANLEKLRQELTHYLGPIAKLAVDRESSRASTLDDLYRRLSEHLPAGAERRAFLDRIPARC